MIGTSWQLSGHASNEHELAVVLRLARAGKTDVEVKAATFGAARRLLIARLVAERGSR
jgi:hypothetical protein